MDKISDERAAEARRLSQLIVGFSGTLVNLAVLPI
jgi:hypothetical protein